MKILKLDKELKNSQEVREFAKDKDDEFAIPYKGGIGIVKNKVVKEIYIGEDAEKNVKNLK